MPLREVKEKPVEEDKKKEKPKAHAPSHAKIRSIGMHRFLKTMEKRLALVNASFKSLPMLALLTGLEMDMPTPAPAKKTPAAPQLGDKYNIKPAVLKRPRYTVLFSYSPTSLCCHALLWPLL